MKDNNDEDTHDMFGDALPNEGIPQFNRYALGDVDAHRWPKRLVELVDIITHVLVKTYGLEVQEAQCQARSVAMAIANYFGGMQIYLPFGAELKRAIRDKEIWNEFNGKNIPELVSRYKMGKSQIYLIIEQQRILHKSRIQPSLF